jgi:hypothetical protein
MALDPTDRVLSLAEVWGLVGIYFPAAARADAVRVCEHESGYHTGAHNDQGEDSRGLFQINVVPASYPALAKFNLYDPMLNVRWAAEIWRDRGWQPWLNTARKLGLLP